MKKLTPKEERQSKLLKYGIPQQFLNNIGEIDELDYSLQKPEGAYFYFPTMTEYTIFTDVEVTPIFDCGENFYALFEKDNGSEIVEFELENDEIYTHYGLNWNLLILDVMWDYFDFAIEEDDSLKLFCAVGEKLGFPYSEKLYELLDITGEEISIKMQDRKKWKNDVAKSLNII